MENDSRRPEEGRELVGSVLLRRMPQQAEVRFAEDDWTGSTDAAERRKRQNRLHQRLYRKLDSQNSFLVTLHPLMFLRKTTTITKNANNRSNPNYGRYGTIGSGS